MDSPTAPWVVMSWFESKAEQNISVKLVRFSVECCFVDFYYDSKVTVVMYRFFNS